MYVVKTCFDVLHQKQRSIFKGQGTDLIAPSAHLRFPKRLFLPQKRRTKLPTCKSQTQKKESQVVAKIPWTTLGRFIQIPLAPHNFRNVLRAVKNTRGISLLSGFFSKKNKFGWSDFSETFFGDPQHAKECCQHANRYVKLMQNTENRE